MKSDAPCRMMAKKMTPASKCMGMDTSQTSAPAPARRSTAAMTHSSTRGSLAPKPSIGQTCWPKPSFTTPIFRPLTPAPSAGR